VPAVLSRELVLELCTAQDRYLEEVQAALAEVQQVPLEAGVEVLGALGTGALEVAVVLLEAAASDHLLRILHCRLASSRLASTT